MGCAVASRPARIERLLERGPGARATPATFESRNRPAGAQYRLPPAKGLHRSEAVSPPREPALAQVRCPRWPWCEIRTVARGPTAPRPTSRGAADSGEVMQLIHALANAGQDDSEY